MSSANQGGNPLHDYALDAYRSLLEQRGLDPLLRANAEETRRRLEGYSLPVDDPNFLAALLIGALTVHQKVTQLAFVEINEGHGMSEPTRSTGQMATGAVIELGMLLEGAINRSAGNS